ncbi:MULTISPECIES: DUF922 domain-containing protein [Pseudomonas]|uniref:DUF922 domain-containing protein n=1 Tax=Pseudomonas TaxID=286 RepID=UPI000C3225E7|nr:MULTISPECIES: DUF922 domain-containing protein [Pseudomonas]PWC98952.1 DUF922 domain-containing protein [Pseudomonas amygdali pv. lachrymans]WNZ87419.1 DUF922 domain-containing protein [Pseudomonas sp. P108]
MMRNGIMAVALLSAASVATAQPEPTIDFDIRYYDVVGATTAEIRSSVFRSTPIRIKGSPYGAITENRFTTGYSSFGTSSGGCEVKNVRVFLESKITLPRLVINGQSAPVLAEWERYIGALRAHEMMHANNGKYTAETVAGRLYNFKSQIPCDQLRSKLDAAVNQLIHNMGVWDQQLDAQTEHGKSQGAFLRPGFR